MNSSDEQRSWTRWLDYWEQTMPAPVVTEDADDDAKDKPRRRWGLIALGSLIALALILVLAFVFSMVLFTPPQNGSTQAVAPSGQTGSAQGDGTTDTDTSEGQSQQQVTGPSCTESAGDGKLVTGQGGPITSPEMLVAEFQHRFFDLRDGKAVAELWPGYEAASMQASIDQSLADVGDEVSWCLTVMPAETGWWNTQVRWWEDGDANVRETWDGTYKIDKKGDSWVFADQRDTAAAD